MDMFPKLPAEALYVVVAAVGGTARYLQHYLNEGNFTFRHFVAHIFVSAFSGYMFFSFAINILGFDEKSMAIVAGLGGWLGVEAMKMMEAVLKKKLQDK
jgi:hypothetical protein